MISISDLIILTVASAALGAGVYRWHQNTTDVSAITIPANSRSVVTTDPLSAQRTPVRITTIAPSRTQQPVVQPTVNTIVASVDNTETAATSTASPDSQVQIGIYQVRSGDYLGKIALRYGTDVQTLRDLNGINGNLILVGQELYYPLAR